jgi:hypothetical protein
MQDIQNTGVLNNLTITFEYQSLNEPVVSLQISNFLAKLNKKPTKLSHFEIFFSSSVRS